MTEGTALSFDDFVGELRELTGRVVAVRVCDVRKEVLVSAEESWALASEGLATVTFHLGGAAPRDAGGIRFVSSSFVVMGVPQFVHATRFEQRTGPPVMHAYTASNVRVEIWPAMPAGEQYTDA